MNYIVRFNEIEKDFNKDVADLVDYDVVDILNSIPEIDDWRIMVKIDETKLDGTEEWLEFFDEPFIRIYSKPGKYSTGKDTDFIEVDLSYFIEKDIFYTASTGLDRTGRERIKELLKSKIVNIELLYQDDTPFDIDLVTSFRVSK
jgi:hypothetical protein